MGHVEDRWYQPQRGDDGKPVLNARGKPVMQPTALHGKGMRYRVRYIAPDGKERSKSFPDRAKKAAEAFLVTTETDKLRGTYVDPRRGKTRFQPYAEAWLASQTFDESTRERMETRFRVHIYPTFGDRELSAIGPEHIREWDRKLQRDGLAQSHRRVLFGHLSTLLSAAVDDERLTKNPCKASTVKAPKVDARKVVPWTRERVAAVRAGLPPNSRVMVDLASGAGLRQGEVFGLAVADLDFLRGWIHVNRQVKIVRNTLVFALPKGRKARDVPLSEELGFLLAAHIERYAPVAVTLPWEVPTGKPVTAQLLVYTDDRNAHDRNNFNRRIWHTALTAARVPLARDNGMHALRHFYASVLLDAGENIKALSAYLGHADQGFTLRTYTHLMPTSETRARKAIDQMLRGGPETGARPGDGLPGLLTHETAGQEAR